MSGLRIIHVKRENTKYRYLHLAAVSAALAAMFVAYASMIETELTWPTVAGSTAAAVICLGVLEELILVSRGRRGMRRAVIAGIGAAVAVSVLSYRLWIHGFAPLVNGYIEKYNEFYGAGLGLMEKSEGAQVFAALFAAELLAGAMLLGILAGGRFLAAAFFIILLPGIFGAFVGYMPSPPASWGLLAVCVLFAIAGHASCGKGWVKELAAGAVVLLILYGCAAWISPSLRRYVGAHEQEYSGIRETLLEAQKLDAGKLLSEHLQGKSNYSKGGVGKGDFRNLSEHHPQGTKELEVIVTERPTSRVYLRAFVGTEYTAAGWKEMGSVRFAEVAAPVVGEGKKKDLLNEPFRRIAEGSSRIGAEKISVKRFGASGDFGYTPYYAQIPNDLTVRLDAYVKGNGRKEWEYDYYPRQAAENMRAGELAEASSLWEEYCAFVEANYKELPQGLDRLKQYSSGMNAGSPDQVEEEIDAEFASGLSYSLEPGECAAGEDFVEYFLFENRKGFCVHFATAATLIYRECGYASRYVEGYAVSPEEFGEQSDGTYRAVVTDEMAHAWCETFDQELGWRMREHTLPYAESQSQPEVLRAENSRTDTEGREPDEAEEAKNPEGDKENEPGSPEENGENESDDSENQRDSAGQGDSGEDPSTAPADGAESDGGEDQTAPEGGGFFGSPSENGSGSGGDGGGTGGLFSGWQNFRGSRAYRIMRQSLRRIGCAALVIVAVWGLGFVWYKLRRQRKLQSFRKKKDNQGIANIYAEIYRICVFLGMKDTGMSEKELEEKWKCEYPYLSEEEWEWLSECAVRSAFSSEMTGKEDWANMYRLYQKFRGGVLRELKGKKKWLFLYGRAL